MVKNAAGPVAIRAVNMQVEDRLEAYPFNGYYSLQTNQPGMREWEKYRRARIFEKRFLP